MTQTFFFGIEFEFHVGSLWNPNLPLPDSAAGRIVHFEVDQQRLSKLGRALDPSLSPALPGESERWWSYLVKSSVYQHIADTLVAAGLPVTISSLSLVQEHAVNEWRIGEETLATPTLAPYAWIPCEIASAALPFNDESLSKAASICRLLQGNYVIHCNEDCGLHLHVSAGKDPPRVLDFATMRKLVAFLWAFEPQINTIHPRYRRNSKYCKSWHRYSALAESLQDEQYVPLFISKGISAIKAASTMDELLSLIADDPSNRNMNCNVLPARKFNSLQKLQKVPASKHLPTIEFRQHRGTMDDVEVTIWITLVLGIVDYCQRVDIGEFDNLLLNILPEHWLKKGNGDIVGKECSIVPVQGRFTAIDLLRRIGLAEAAIYYLGRTFPP
jgi:hypothetical protein